MATADTGIDETQRETPRTFSQWANLMLESAGGGNLALRGAGNTGTSLAATVLAESDSFTGGDVGDTAASAKALTLSLLPISGLEAANTVSSLTTGADVDYYKFDVTGPSSILADVWSDDLYINDFDPILTLFDTDGISILFSVDNTTYTGNFYNDGGTARTLDPALLNIVLPTAGTYFLRVGSVADITAPDGGNYNLVFGVASIPEARTWLTMGAISVGALGMCLLRHRSQPAVFAGAPVRDSRHSEPANSS
jgi:hypothetical protein